MFTILWRYVFNLTRGIFQSMLKKVLEKFYKGRHCDSKMYPSDSSVTQSLLYLVKKFSDDPVNAVKYIQNDEIRYKFWYRSKRNRLSRLVREGYIQQLNRLSLEGTLLVYTNT